MNRPHALGSAPLLVTLLVTLLLAAPAAAGDPPAAALEPGAPLPSGGFTHAFGPGAQGEPAPVDETALETAPEKAEWDPFRADAAAPFGVLGGRTLEEGEWVVALRYERSTFSGLQNGSSGVSSTEAFDLGYLVAPTEMTSESLTVRAMYAANETVTFTMSVPWVSKSMDNLAVTGERYTTSASGVGDAQLAWLFRFVDRPTLRAHVNFGLGVPTGSTNESDSTPSGDVERLPYPMQLGTGTFDLQPGLTFLGQLERWSWGAQALYTARLGRNPDNYRFGDVLDVNLWGARAWSRALSTSVRLRYFDQGAVSGVDDQAPTLDAPPGFPSPAGDPTLQGGSRIDLGVGLNAYLGDGIMTGNRFGAELLFPLDQDLNGPQLEQDWAFVLGWQYSF